MDELFNLSDPLCPLGYSQPCIYCLQCPQANYREFTGSNYQLRKTTNSAILNLRLPVRDDLERLIVETVVRELPRHFWFVLDRPEEGWHVSIFVRKGDVWARRRIERVISWFLEEVPQIIERVRLTIRGYVSDRIAQLVDELKHL